MASKQNNVHNKLKALNTVGLQYLESIIIIIRELISNTSDIFEPRTARGSDLFSSITCLLAIIFLLLSIVSPIETISLKIWERPLF